MYKFILIIIVFLSFKPELKAQTWFPVAKDGDTISIPVGITSRYGDPKGTLYAKVCGTGPVL